jgi:hypothetical protein
MSDAVSIRWGWLKAMYIYTLIGAGGTGLAFLAVPGLVQKTLGMPKQDPFVFGVYGCVLLASGLLAIPALRYPLKFAPLLLVQLVYKPLWFVAVVVPAALKGHFPFYAAFLGGVFLTYIVGDLIAIPFSYLFKKKDVTASVRAAERSA